MHKYTTKKSTAKNVGLYQCLLVHHDHQKLKYLSVNATNKFHNKQKMSFYSDRDSVMTEVVKQKSVQET